MNRKKLLDMIENGTSVVRAFIANEDHPLCGSSSFEDWNDRDVVGHIIGWMDYSIDKLSCIKLGTKQSNEYAHATSLTEINTMLYEKMKGKSREEIESGYIKAVGGYIRVIRLYSNDEINLDTFDIGFKMDLWRYMVMDTVIHPIQHVLYQYLKGNRYEDICSIIAKTSDVFYQYSSGHDGYRLSEFGIERPEYQEKLMKLAEACKGDSAIRTFVQVNMKGNT